MICKHVSQIRPVHPTSDGCVECIKAGRSWVSLRMCVTCGHVGCCDSSPSKHARLHFHDTGHPIVRSFEQGEDWCWCYEDEAYVEPDLVEQAGMAFRRAELHAARMAPTRFDPFGRWLG